MVVFKSIYSLDDSDIMPNKHKEKKQRVATQAEIDREDTVNNIVETCIQQIDVIATYAATDLRNSMLTNVASDAIRNKDRSTWKAYAQSVISSFQEQDGIVYITEDIVNEATTAVNDAMYQTALEAISASIARDSNIHRSTATNDNPFSMLGEDMVSDSDESEPPLEERGVDMSSAAVKSGPAMSGTYGIGEDDAAAMYGIGEDDAAAAMSSDADESGAKEPADRYNQSHLNAFTLWKRLIKMFPLKEGSDEEKLGDKLDLMQETAEIGAGYIANTHPNDNGVSRTGGLIDDEFRNTDTWGEIKLD